MTSVIDTQLKHNDCGISVAKTICNIFKVDISRKYIEDSLFLDAQGSRLSDIKAFFDNNGFTTDYKLLDMNYAASGKSYLENIFPFILPVNNKDGVHFVVVDGIKKGKLKIFDPVAKRPYYLTLNEVKNIAYYNNSYVDYNNTKEKVGVICNQVLSDYLFDVEGVNRDITFDVLYNKISYFLYVREEYGLKDWEAEKKCLSDILYHQEIGKLPKHFKTLRYENEKLRIKTPVVLSIKLEGNASEIIKEENNQKEENIYITLFKQLGKSKKIWYLYIFAAITSASVTQLSVFINQILIDDILYKHNLSIILLFAIGVALFKIFDLATSLYKSWIGVKVGRILDEHFLHTFDKKLNDFSLSYIQGYKRGDLTERLSDSMKLKAFFLRFFTRIMVDTFVSIYTLGILLYIDWQLTLVVVVVMILFYVWFRIITPYLKQNERMRFINKADFFSKMIEKLEGIQVLKSTHIEDSYSQKVRKSIYGLLNIQVRTQKVSILNGAVSSLITIIASVFIIYFLSEKYLTEGVITTGQIITFIALSHRIFSSLGSILDENLTLQENQVILKRYLDFKEASKPINIRGIKNFSLNNLRMQNVAFGYHPEELILKDITIDIDKGDKIKIEGRNGSGKSTLSKILSLLYPPVKGEIIVNGVGADSYNTKELKEKILLVSNEDILFNDTFSYNLTFGKEMATKQVYSLAKDLQLYDFIQSKENSLEFMISENGKNLSTGQRKKILLLRALLHDAELIILDEVLAGIDSQSREEIESCLNKVSNKTFIIISHEPIHSLEFNKTYVINEGVLFDSVP